MKIDNISHSSIPSRIERGQGQGKVADAAPAQGASARSATRFSTVASNASQDIDQGRVSELRNAIANGELAVNTDRISDRLIDNVRDLLGSI